MSSSTVSGMAVREAILAREQQYLFQNYARYPLVMERGEGCYLYDVDGKRYLDFLSGIGVNSLGHAHPRVVEVIREQAALLVHTSNLYYHQYQGLLAERLAQISGMERSFFCNSGAEAMEGAIKIVRGHGNRTGGRHGMIALEDAFHGRTMGAVSITGQPKYRKDFEPLLDRVTFVPRADPAGLEAAVTRDTAGIFIEIIQGESGIFPVPEAMIRKARELADRHNALLVFDEIQCGVGRPGAYFGYQLFDPPVKPDVVITAKPLGAGLPLGVIMATDAASRAIGSGMHGTTFGGGALVCRVALEFLNILDTLLPSIRDVGSHLKQRLEELAREFPFIKDVRGRGLMLGVELDRPCKDIVMDAMAAGLLVNCTHETVIRMLPAFILTRAQADEGVEILRRVLAKHARA